MMRLLTSILGWGCPRHPNQHFLFRRDSHHHPSITLPRTEVRVPLLYSMWFMFTIVTYRRQNMRTISNTDDGYLLSTK